MTVQYLVMADLLSIGYSELDAYTIAYPENTALSALQNKSIREKILSSVKLKHLVEEKSAQSCDLLIFSPLFNNIRIYTIKKGGTTLAVFRPSLSVPPPCCYRASGGLPARRLFFFSTFSGVLSGNAML